MAKSVPSFSVKLPVALPRNKQPRKERLIDLALRITTIVLILYGILTLVQVVTKAFEIHPITSSTIFLPYVSLTLGFASAMVLTVWRRRQHGELTLREHSLSIQLSGRPRFSHKLGKLNRLRLTLNPPDERVATNRSTPFSAVNIFGGPGNMQRVHRASKNILFYSSEEGKSIFSDQEVNFLLPSPRDYKRLKYLIKLWREHGYTFELLYETEDE
ncbi:MAG: hypothetical protein ACOCZ8_00060 [Bacteroidota bacterium]